MIEHHGSAVFITAPEAQSLRGRGDVPELFDRAAQPAGLIAGWREVIAAAARHIARDVGHPPSGGPDAAALARRLGRMADVEADVEALLPFATGARTRPTDSSISTGPAGAPPVRPDKRGGPGTPRPRAASPRRVHS